MTARQASGPAVALGVTTVFVTGVLSVFMWVGRYILWPVARSCLRLVRRRWVDLGRRRALTKGRRQFRLSRRTRRRMNRGDYAYLDPQLTLRALWWCIWVMGREVSAVNVADRMNRTDKAFEDAVGFVASQIYAIPTRHPLEIDAAVWAHELRSLHGIDQPLPGIES